MSELIQKPSLQEVAEAVQKLSLQEVIFDPGRFLGGVQVAVSGEVVVLDLELQRMDLAHNGAKLIVQLGQLDQASSGRLKMKELDIGTMVVVTGCIKKAQRRTFMEAHILEVAAHSSK
eukprot:gnl/MRDRNA2_/MRDRNA2_89634_c0_seq1.p1 gnl/MRDRNA2_/MRDRNA2_89634_c0~~gnl/MRDRNA2_/MRDRNA2_89634_c0_seq1.p1  ORF type:complete len:118 (-),score=34.99 gnl/MRDRNA2_/MRDRNA2_89634_c0_seq1:108-461(-)